MGLFSNSNRIEAQVNQPPEDSKSSESAGHFAGRALSCQRGGRAVFNGLEFSLGPGQALVLTGPNGAGKTSALRVMAGLLRPSGGSISWDNDPIADDPSAHAKRLSLVGHNDALKPAWTLSQNLSFWARFAGAHAPQARVDAALASLDLSQLRDVPVGQLSRGQARRGALARLLLVDRPLWLLDEPTASLDTASSELVANLIEEHRSRGGRAVIATHLPLGLVEPSILEFTPALDNRTP